MNGQEDRTTTLPGEKIALPKRVACWNIPSKASHCSAFLAAREPQTTLDVALPPDAIDAVVFESYGEPASRTET